MNAFGAALNGIAVGFNAAALVFLQREETWFMWSGIIICGGWMVWFCLPPRRLALTNGVRDTQGEQT